jgi:hypothetical protein
VVGQAERHLEAFRDDEGYEYDRYRPRTPPDVLVPEDLAVTVLVNSRFDWRAFRTVMARGATLRLSDLPPVALEASTAADRTRLTALLAEVAAWPGFAASLATKVLHKKRPALIPLLDNRAIFGAYTYPAWPGTRSQGYSVKDVARIGTALEWITRDLTRPENTAAWVTLRALEPGLTPIELFDAVWWRYFRTVEPVNVLA